VDMKHKNVDIGGRKTHGRYTSAQRGHSWQIAIYIDIKTSHTIIKVMHAWESASWQTSAAGFYTEE